MSGELVRSIDWKGAFWVASGVPALVLFSIGGIAGTTGKIVLVVAPLSRITAGGKDVGVVTSTTFSPHLMKSLAMALVQPAFTRVGTELVVHDGGDLRATIVQMPFYDPMRLRTHPLTERK
jgi:aminomethyltransferase